MVFNKGELLDITPLFDPRPFFPLREPAEEMLLR